VARFAAATNLRNNDACTLRFRFAPVAILAQAIWLEEPSTVRTAWCEEAMVIKGEHLDGELGDQQSAQQPVWHDRPHLPQHETDKISYRILKRVAGDGREHDGWL
jgi:hypothetical protein